MKRILVLDDDETILKALEDSLTYLNYNVSTLQDAGHLFSTIEAFKPDLLLLDFMLSNSNGGAICHQLKTSAGLSQLPVIIMSGFDDVSALSEKSGCNYFIKKPFDLYDLDKTIKACLQGQEKGRQSPPLEELIS